MACVSARKDIATAEMYSVIHKHFKLPTFFWSDMRTIASVCVSRDLEWGSPLMFGGAVTQVIRGKPLMADQDLDIVLPPFVLDAMSVTDAYINTYMQLHGFVLRGIGGTVTEYSSNKHLKKHVRSVETYVKEGSKIQFVFLKHGSTCRGFLNDVDLSCCQIAIDILTRQFCCASSFEDVIAGRGRVLWDVAKLSKGEKAKLISRVKKYEMRGFTIAGKTYETVLVSEEMGSRADISKFIKKCHEAAGVLYFPDTEVERTADLLYKHLFVVYDYKPFKVTMEYRRDIDDKEFIHVVRSEAA